MRILPRLSFLVTSTILSACSLRMGDMTALATRNVHVEAQPLGRSVEGRDCTHWIFGLIPIASLVPNIQEATDRALAKVPEGNAMTDVRLYSDPLFIPYVYSRDCIRVKGDVVKVTEVR